MYKYIYEIIRRIIIKIRNPIEPKFWYTPVGDSFITQL